MPYSQILAPIYNLASERYLYFPSFVLVFGIAYFIFFTISEHSDNKKIVYSTLISITLALSIRGYIRTLDWKDNVTLYSSAVNAAKNPLFKAFRYRSITEKIFAQYPEREVDIKYQNLAVQNLKKAIVLYEKRIKKRQSSVPEIVKVYGLDPETLLEKSAYLLSQFNFTMTNDPKSSLKIIEPYIKNLSVLDSSAIAFYASILHYNDMSDKAIEVLSRGYELRPYSTRIILTLCDLLYIKYGDLRVIENHCLKAFKYFPYDSSTTYALANIYHLMNNHEKYAYFSYIYGLRNHSVEALKTAYNEYMLLNEKSKAEETMKKINFTERELQKRK